MRLIMKSDCFYALKIYTPRALLNESEVWPPQLEKTYLGFFCQLVVPLNLLEIILPWSTSGLIEAFNWALMMPRNSSLSDGCTSDRSVVFPDLRIWTIWTFRAQHNSMCVRFYWLHIEIYTEYAYIYAYIYIYIQNILPSISGFNLHQDWKKSHRGCPRDERLFT